MPTEVLTFKINHKQVKEYGMRLTFIHLVAECQIRTHTHQQMMYILLVTRGHKKSFANEAI